MRDRPPDGPAVALIFPPLIESSFGSFFPSTAVLSAFLKDHGIATVQYDLNQEFAGFLMGDRMLADLGAGRIPGVIANSAVAGVARWAARNKGRLFDERGRLRGRPGGDGEFGYVAEMLSQPFHLDADAGDASRLQDRHPADAYHRFFTETGIAGRLPAEVGLVGVSVPMGPQLLPALLLAAHLKDVRPDVRLVLGGPTLSLMDESDLATLLRTNRAVDCVVRFDGEFPLLELAEQVIAGRWAPEGVPGVSCVRGDEVAHTPPAPGPDLNRLPPPDYPPAALDGLAEPILAVIQARGCYWGKCDYCDFVELFHGSPPFRGRRPDNFVDEIEGMVERTGIRRFRFITESIPPAFARRACELIVERGLKVRWSSFAMVDRRFDRDLLALMVEAGCDFLVIGLETTNTRVLQLVHKSADREENLRFLRDAREVGMRLTINLIPDLPTTTYDEAMSSLADVEMLADCIEQISIFPFEPTRSSNVGRHPERFGLVPAGRQGAGMTQYALNHLDSVDPAMTDEERAEVIRRYSGFAAAVNHRAAPTAAPPAPGVARVRIPVEEADLFWAGEDLVGTQVRTRKRLTINGGDARLLEPHLNGHPFSVQELAAAPGRAEALANRLAKAGLLVAAASAAEG
jgi:hypothetical protein